MNHILKMKKMVKWLMVYLLIPWGAIAAAVLPVTLMYIFSAAIQGEMVELLRQLGTGILSAQSEMPMVLVQFFLQLWLLSFLKNRLLWELNVQEKRVTRRGQYIHRIRQVLKAHHVEAEYPQETGSERIWKEAAQENRRLRKRSTLLMVLLWIMLGLLLIRTAWGWPAELETYGIWLGSIILLYKAAQIFLTIYMGRNLLSEDRLLEMSLREQKKEIEALEQQCSQNHISMDEVWGTAEKYAKRRTNTKGT